MKKQTGIERLQPKKKKKMLDKIVIGVLVYWLVFVTVAWVAFFIKDSIPDTLVTVGLGGGSIELIITGTIEIFKDKLHKEGES